MPRNKRNIKSFVQEYENSAQPSVTLKKQIVKHTLMQAHNFVTKTKNSSQQNPAAANQKMQQQNHAHEAEATASKGQKQKNLAKIQAKSNVASR